MNPPVKSRRSELSNWHLCHSRLPPVQLQLPASARSVAVVLSIDVPSQPVEHSPIGTLRVIELRGLDDLADAREPSVVHDAAERPLANRTFADQLVTILAGSHRHL